jgi:hypothetical protein
MQSREFLKPAQTLANELTEADWRGSAVHTYYALFLECRDALARWGSLPPGRYNVHAAARLKLVYAKDADLKQIGSVLERLGTLGTEASYDMATQQQFSSSNNVRQAITSALAALALLDAIEADPQRRTAAIASLPP